MRELLPDLENWLNNGNRVALATVISTWGSAPRRVGSTMAVNEGGAMVGSVSGGCVEGAVVQAAREVLQTGIPKRLHFGVADETAWGVGLACGGEIDIYVQPVITLLYSKLIPKIASDLPVSIATVIEGDGLGAQILFNDQGEVLAATDSLTLDPSMRASQPVTRKIGNEEIFVNPILPLPTLIMVGGVHIAVALAKIAQIENFRTVIVDPRKAFGSADRFAHADKLIQAWPPAAFAEALLSSNTALASLSHDPKIDDPALIAALKSDAFYIGALGSRKTQKKRRARLLNAGITEERLKRLNAPIGMEIGAETPEEIALAIMAQVVAAYRSDSALTKGTV
ncbi:MAG: XdhC family protein [Anaerolineales bacterium]